MTSINDDYQVKVLRRIDISNLHITVHDGLHLAEFCAARDYRMYFMYI